MSPTLSHILILASASPRRRDLLTQAGIAFEVLPADIDETQRAGESPTAYVQRLALEKALAARALRPHAPVLGVDTTVELEGRVLGKPADRAEAATMLRALSGRSHRVHSGVALVSAAGERCLLETTQVTFAPIPEADLAHYLATGDSLDKAGGYGIQGYPARWVTRIEGDFFNIVGLPLAATVRLLREAGELG